MKSLVTLGGPSWPDLLEPLLPGAHVAVFAEDVALDGFRGRKAGLELRDTLLVLYPGVTTRFVLLFRKECQEGTVAEQVLATGTGGINIDSCRVNSGPSSSVQRRMNRAPGLSVGDTGWVTPPRPASYNEQKPGELLGRWPPNVLLVHGEGCHVVGTREVKSGTAYEPQPKQMNRSVFGVTNTLGRIQGFANGDGLETVPNWNCQPDCPVRFLDEQTGTLTSGAVAPHHMRNASTQPSNGGFNGKFGDMPLMGYGDSGGASRFFPQFKDDLELMSWVRRLITP